MKKLLSLVLCAMFTMGSTMVASAAPTPDKVDATGNSKRPVTISASTYDAVYRIDVTWDALDFTYTFSQWDADNVEYAAGSSWSLDKNIVVENRSNAPIIVDATFEGSGAKNSNVVKGVTASITSTDSNFKLDAADAPGYSVSSLPTKTLKVSVAGVPEDKQQFELDNIIIKIDKNA